MDKIFALTGDSGEVHVAKQLFLIFLCAASTWRNFKNIFSRPLITIIFRSKIVILDTDSILRVKTMYESVK